MRSGLDDCAVSGKAPSSSPQASEARAALSFMSVSQKGN